MRVYGTADGDEGMLFLIEGDYAAVATSLTGEWCAVRDTTLVDYIAYARLVPGVVLVGAPGVANTGYVGCSGVRSL